MVAEPVAEVVAAEAAAEVVPEPVAEASSVEPVDLAPAATVAVDASALLELRRWLAIRFDWRAG